MGPRDTISGDKNSGCCYCRWYNNVQHPKGGGSRVAVMDYSVMMALVVLLHLTPKICVRWMCLILHLMALNMIEPGHVTSVLLKTCILQHVDFTAKKTDVTDAPEEMFFAELITTSGVRCIKFCRRMGPRDSISGLHLTCRCGCIKTNGSCYCRLENVQHPKGGGFSRGGTDLFLDC
ncbi:hypothetical protein MKW92_019454 [Papaver armeniacum]|nr:hypothetical protein MKW92_019454 [Papaver armeniacum]